MRKMILVALAGFLWKKYQSRGAKAAVSDQPYSEQPLGRS
jgi:hypothetical protein